MTARTDPLTASLVACAVLVTAALVKREFFSRSELPQPVTRVVADWQTLATGGHTFGSSAAPVTIVEFSDFQCPSCATVQPTLRGVLTRHPAEVAVVYRHFPLNIHPQARQAALASECAAEQGRFHEFHDLLYARQDSIGRIAWNELARRAQVPRVEEFQRCFGSGRYSAKVEDDFEAGRRIRLRGTPTLVVNGVVVEGAVDSVTLEGQIRRAIAELPRPGRRS